LPVAFPPSRKKPYCCNPMQAAIATTTISLSLLVLLITRTPSRSDWLGVIVCRGHAGEKVRTQSLWLQRSVHWSRNLGVLYAPHKCAVNQASLCIAEFSAAAGSIPPAGISRCAGAGLHELFGAQRANQRESRILQAGASIQSANFPAWSAFL
jgi:hypothetical protein